ncbi:MAG: adenylate kinase [Actinomycetota bacterium]
MRIVILGPPGAGKGTQACRLAEHLGIPHIATGDIFRQVAAEDTALGRRLRATMDSGELVPDDFTNELVKDRLAKSDASNGFILDGYPRNVEQAAALDDALDELGTKISYVVKFMVRGDDIVERLAGRRICPECGAVYHMQSHPPQRDEECDHDGAALVRREDDTAETVLHRLDVYGEQTRPLYDFYRERGKLIEMDALGSTDEVFERLLGSLGR